MKVNSHGPKTTFQKELQTQPQLIRELKGHLWSLDSSISPVLIDLLNKSSGLQQRVVLLLREGITRNHRNPSLLNYLYIIDYLLTMPAYNLALHHYLAQYYCDLFKHLLSQQNFEGIEKMKVFRKYWISKVDYRLYRDLERIIYQCFGIDIEWIQENAIHDLQKFYLEQLHMTFEDVARELPQLRRQIEEPNRVIYSVNRTKKDEEKGKNKDATAENKNAKLQKAKYSQKHSEEHKKSSKKKSDQSKSRQTHQLPCEQSLTLKRKREQSQETTLSLNMKGNKKMKYSLQTTLDSSTSDQVIIIDPKTTLAPRSNKKKTQSECRVEERAAIKGFNFLICHVCLQCGIKFQLEKELVAHMEAKQCSLQKPSESQTKENHDDCVLVKEEDAHLYTRRCHVCDFEMDVDYANGDWKFNKAVKITQYDIPSIIHASCLKDVIPETIDNLEQDSTEEQ